MGLPNIEIVYFKNGDKTKNLNRRKFNWIDLKYRGLFSLANKIEF